MGKREGMAGGIGATRGHAWGEGRRFALLCPIYLAPCHSGVSGTGEVVLMSTTVLQRATCRGGVSGKGNESEKRIIERPAKFSVA